MFPTPGRGLERLTQESGATFPKSELGSKPDSGQLDLRSKGHGGEIWTTRDKIGANRKTESKLSGKSTGCISSDPLQGESQGNLHVDWEERQPSCSRAVLCLCRAKMDIKIHTLQSRFTSLVDPFSFQWPCYFEELITDIFSKSEYQQS